MISSRGSVTCSYKDVTRKFFWGGQSHFSWFFPGVKCFFPVENFHFGRPKTNCSGFEKWEEQGKKRKKKRSSPHFVIFPPSIFNFTIFLLFFSIVTPFPFFPCLLFPGRSAEISWSEVCLWGALCPLLHLFMPLSLYRKHNISTVGQLC